MKMKSFAALVMPILLAASFTYAVPALADDAANPAMQSPSATDNSSAASGDSSTPPAASDNAGSSSDANSNNSNPNPSSGSDGNQEDTPTGDDDY